MGGQHGKFITFEGIEGSGKTTQLRLLADHLAGRGVDCARTKQPGGTVIGAEIRKILLNPSHHEMAPICEAMLYLADRAQHHAELILPALTGGRWVLCDRYHDSTRAYQGAARGVSGDELERMFALATGSFEPDLTILLDLDPAAGLARALRRNDEHGLAAAEGRFENERLAFHQAVRRSFLRLADRQQSRFLVVEASREPGAIAAEIRDAIEARWKDCLV